MRIASALSVLVALAVTACGGEAPLDASAAGGDAAFGANNTETSPADAATGAQPEGAAAQGDAADPMSGPGLLARVKQTYAGLTTYSDTATIDIEQALPGVSTTLKASHSFSTKFTRPRQFKFDFREGEGDRYVIWASGDSFFTWWKSTSVTEEYPKGEGATAFATAQLPTAGGALMVSPLLFAEAGLVGPLTGLETPEFAGAETLDGRETYKIKDDVRLNHWSDATRPTTVWIDAESFLVRKVLEERPSNTDLTDTITTIINPQANPTIPANEYTFTPPKT